MQSDLLITAIVLAWGAMCAAFGYCAGKRAADEHLLDELDETTRLLHETAAMQRHPSRLAIHPLTDAELDRFLRGLKAEGK
jgi:hypothetical protein